MSSRNVSPHDLDTQRYRVALEIYLTVWPANQPNPPNWNDTGKNGTKTDCFNYLHLEAERSAAPAGYKVIAYENYFYWKVEGGAVQPTPFDCYWVDVEGNAPACWAFIQLATLDKRDKSKYKVVINNGEPVDEHYRLVPAERPVPPLWKDAGVTGTKEECCTSILWENQHESSIQLIGGSPDNLHEATWKLYFVNDLERYQIVPAYLPAPPNWEDTGKSGTLSDCCRHWMEDLKSLIRAIPSQVKDGRAPYPPNYTFVQWDERRTGKRYSHIYEILKRYFLASFPHLIVGYDPTEELPHILAHMYYFCQDRIMIEREMTDTAKKKAKLEELRGIIDEKWGHDRYIAFEQTVRWVQQQPWL
jgi:uncharacterized protein YbdZ (MbtH family)